MTSLIVNDIFKSYGSQPVLEGLSFELQPGSVTGFLGANGTGKTTCFKILVGLIPPDSGEVLINGISVQTTSNDDFKRHIGYLPENNPLYPHMYLFENLQWWARVMGVRDVTRRVHEVMDMLQLQSHRRHRIHDLSKGYKQRVGIAQAIIHDPDILILDEPINGLDPLQIDDVRTLIRNLGEEKIVIYSTHILQEVEATCDRVLILHRGRIATDTTPEDLQSLVHGDHRMRVAFEQPIDTHDFILKLPHLNIEIIDDKSFIVNNKKNKNTHKYLFQWAIDNNTAIREMYEIKDDVHGLFARFTENK